MHALNWTVGEEVAVDRARFAKIERITKSGRPIVEGKQYNPDGSLRGGNTYSECIEKITPKLLARVTGRKLDELLAVTQKWARIKFGYFGNISATPADMERADRLIKALEENNDET